MKTKLIKTQDKFILVSDEEIKEGEILPYVMKWENGYEIFNTNNGIRKSKLNRAYKIIAGIPELPSVDFSLLSEADCKEIGWADVEKLAREYADFAMEEMQWANRMKRATISSFTHGFKTAQSLNDKMFEVKEVVELCKILISNPFEKCGKTYQELTDSYIQSLQQTSWDVEVEMEKVGSTKDGLEPWINIYKPKITNNSIKIVKIL